MSINIRANHQCQYLRRIYSRSRANMLTCVSFSPNFFSLFECPPISDQDFVNGSLKIRSQQALKEFNSSIYNLFIHTLILNIKFHCCAAEFEIYFPANPKVSKSVSTRHESSVQFVYLDIAQ